MSSSLVSGSSNQTNSDTITVRGIVGGKEGLEEIEGEAERLKDLLNIQDEMSSNY